jgi:hypothetical protein
LILQLTKDQIELLQDILRSYWDKGPYDEGGQSKELKKLTAIVDETIEKDGLE